MTKEALELYKAYKPLDRLPIPLICECGFATLSCKEAAEHLEGKHPEMLEKEV